MKKIDKFDIFIDEAKRTCPWESLYYGNVSFLLKKLQSPKIYVEIGTAHGFHIENILQEFTETICYSVDPYKPYENDWFSNTVVGIDTTISPDENFDLFAEKVISRLLKYKNFKQIRKTSDNAVNDFSDEQIDLIFIDGNHTYEYVKNDCNLWWNKIKSGGIMCGDDYYMDETRKAVDEFSSNKKLEFVSKQNGYLTWFIEKN